MEMQYVRFMFATFLMENIIVVLAGNVAQAIAPAILEGLGAPAQVQTQHRVRSVTCTKEYVIGSKTNSCQSATSVP